MTTWHGHTTRASRGQRSVPCPTCGTLRYTPLAMRVIKWLNANPTQCLTYGQIVEQFNTTMGTARWAMTKACREGKVFKRTNPASGREVEFFSKRWADWNSPMARREHVSSDACWCHPTAEYIDPETGVTVWVHNREQ